MEIEKKCPHVDEKGLTTKYKEVKDEDPIITCKLCKGKLTRKEFRERVEFVAQQYKNEQFEKKKIAEKKLARRIKNV